MTLRKEGRFQSEINIRISQKKRGKNKRCFKPCNRQKISMFYGKNITTEQQFSSCQSGKIKRLKYKVSLENFFDQETILSQSTEFVQINTRKCFQSPLKYFNCSIYGATFGMPCSILIPYIRIVV